jgi:RasGEF domain/RasGEF N-terminal motif
MAAADVAERFARLDEAFSKVPVRETASRSDSPLASSLKLDLAALGDRRETSPSRPISPLSAKGVRLSSGRRSQRHKTLSRNSGMALFTQIQDDGFSPTFKSSQAQAQQPDLLSSDTVFDTRENVLELVATTEAKLLEFVMNPDADSQLATVWLHTYDYVMEPSAWLSVLVQAFLSESHGELAPEGIRANIIELLRKWIKVRFRDFLRDDWLMDQLVDFVGVILPAHGMLEDAKVLHGEIHAHVRLAANGPPRWGRGQDSSIPDPHVPKVPSGDALKLLDMVPVEVARQLCMMDHELLHNIPLYEFCKQGWDSEDSGTLAPNLLKKIAFCNDLSLWAATEVVSQSSLRTRVAVLKALIMIAKKCMECGNPSCGMSVIAGLHSGSVSRLKRTWKPLSSKYMDAFDSITSVLQGSQNFKSYRALLDKAKPPCSPYLGVTLRDLTFIEDGNDYYFDKDRKLVNVDKLRMISELFLETRRLQTVPYRFEVVRRIRKYIEDAPRIEGDQLWNASMLCEPDDQGHHH